MSGIVYLNGQRADKAGVPVADDDVLEIRGESMPYVSRGGLKLEKALRCFDLDLNGSVCCDFGASTGGFTDCMLKNGALRVYAIDVGYGQLAWTLRGDPRVINMERTNVRYLAPQDIGEPVDFISIDLAFISLSLVLKPAYDILEFDRKVLCLVKPQFEAGRAHVGKKGVVKDPHTHAQVIVKVKNCALAVGFSPMGLDYSPIKGPQGNIEYLLLLQKPRGSVSDLLPEETIRRTVQLSHDQLDATDA
jgi:23S rRNA (cytidine1920-2'-O)/16S rRNA (cytidine1409-2'-O)-methyltransferase